MDAKEMWEIAKNKSRYYHRFQVKKKTGGFRTIQAPLDPLKSLQSGIYQNVLSNVLVSQYAHGFVDDRSIYTNAKKHVDSICVVNLDLKDFFPSVTKEMIIRNLEGEVETPYAIAELTTLKDVLPQGTPTSPCLSNIVCRELDRKLGNLAGKYRARYTRYADDLTFSSKKNTDLHKIISKAHSFIKRQGFDINYKKINVMRRGGRQVVTGLTVNDKVTVL
jgi:RNA-directed DNA polymerase